MKYKDSIYFVQLLIDIEINVLRDPSWSWSIDCWIYSYMRNQCLSPLKLWVCVPFMASCIQYNIMWYILSVTCDRSVVFSTNKTDYRDITEILLEVALNTITLTPHYVQNVALSMIPYLCSLLSDCLQRPFCNRLCWLSSTES